MSEDYFDAVEAAVREAQREDPDVVLKWSWWKEQAERHGMTPNAVYTRAVKIGLYVPPDKRENGEAEFEAEADVEPSLPPTSALTAEPPAPPAAASSPRSSGRNGRAPSPQPSSNLGDAIQGFASLVERASSLEQQVSDLRQNLERSRQENRRLRRALREMEDLMERMRQVYRSVVALPEDE
jgi:hypothetical protein